MELEGFPLYTDEGHYMRRSLVVLEGIGIQEKTSFYRDAYDHLFLVVLTITGYPNFAMSQLLSSIGLAIAFPKVIIEIFVIIDTYLVFKISELF